MAQGVFFVSGFRIVAACVMTWALLGRGAYGDDEPTEESDAHAHFETIFIEDFKTLAAPRFTQVSEGETNFDLNAGTMRVTEGVGLVRPVQAGPFVELKLTLEFAGLVADGDGSETQFGLVLANGQVAIARLLRERAKDGIKARIEFLRAGEQQPAPQVMRVAELESDFTNGEWSFEYRHGLLVVRRDKEELARGYLETPYVPVLGVTWSQPKSSLTCSAMRLDGEPVAQPRSADDEKLLAKAQELNDKGMELYRQKKFTEALAPTRQASEIYEKVLGQEHKDTANSYSNVAALYEKVKQYSKAVTYYEKALQVRRVALGADHPETVVLEFNLGNMAALRKDHAEARRYYTRCLDEFQKTSGKDSPICKSLAAVLRDLPQE